MRWNNHLLHGYHWCREISDLATKQRRARTIVAEAQNGQVIGVGTGSSSYVGLCALAERIKTEGLQVTVIPAASEIELACASLGVPMTTLDAAKPDWCFDGADEIGADGSVVKGRGGGLFREKLIIAAADKRWLIAEDRKFVDRVGACPIPVEVFPQAVHLVEGGLTRLGATDVRLRLATSKDGPVITENGNLLLDCTFAAVEPGLEQAIKALPGVIESGLFQGYHFSFLRD